MKICTLTLHLPFNYGNALQQFSLHKYLLEKGYDAEVLSHWFCENEDEILLFHNRLGKNPFKWIRFLVQCLMFNGQLAQYRRESKIKKWLNNNIRWSVEQGANSKFPVEKLTHDVIIVGSDQVWNPVYQTSDFFLLGDFPEKIKKLAYAASFGSNDFPESKKEFYYDRLAKFNAISVRESSGVSIIKDMGLGSLQVCDPTLLHSRDEWIKILGLSSEIEEKKELMIYFVTPDYKGLWKEAIRIARESGKKVHVYAFIWSNWTDCRWRPGRQAIRRCLTNCYVRLMLFFSGVRLHFSSDPTDFVKRIATCEGVITDSFHGMMFATIFEKKCNVVIGEHPERQQMSARLKDFARDYGNQEIFTEKMNLSALRKLNINDNLKQLILNSKQWIVTNIKIR